MKKGIPAVYSYSEQPQFDSSEVAEAAEYSQAADEQYAERKTVPPKQDEFIWQWKVCS